MDLVMSDCPNPIPAMFTLQNGFTLNDNYRQHELNSLSSRMNLSTAALSGLYWFVSFVFLSFPCCSELNVCNIVKESSKEIFSFFIVHIKNNSKFS